jgi:hypothetical protein
MREFSLFNPDTSTPPASRSNTVVVDPLVTQANQEALMSAQFDALHGAPWIARAQSDNPNFPPLTQRMGLLGMGDSNDTYLRQFAFNA